MSCPQNERCSRSCVGWEREICLTEFAVHLLASSLISQEDALQALLEQMCLYPGNTIFFLNVWCFGWEEVVKEVSRHFGEPVRACSHADRV